MAPPAPGAPPGGGPVRVPPFPAPAGGVKPWLFKHCWNAVRVALVAPLLEDADVEVVPELLEELEPHAASARLAVTAASAGISRSARRGVLVEDFMCVLSWLFDQPPAVVAVPLAPPAVVPLPLAPPVVGRPPPAVPAVRTPESLREVATTVPPEFFTPWTTTASPG